VVADQKRSFERTRVKRDQHAEPVAKRKQPVGHRRRLVEAVTPEVVGGAIVSRQPFPAPLAELERRKRCRVDVRGQFGFLVACDGFEALQQAGQRGRRRAKEFTLVAHEPYIGKVWLSRFQPSRSTLTEPDFTRSPRPSSAGCGRRAS